MRKILLAAISVLLSIFALSCIVIASNDLVIKSCSAKGKKIALTFDDGPHPKNTGEILDILRDYGIKATFFVIGENVELYPELIWREISEGHELGNHTVTHTSLLKADIEKMECEVGKLSEKLEEKFSYKTSLLRPPGGAYNDAVTQYAKENGFNVILWSVDTRDWAHTPVPEIEKNVLENTKDGAIILFHDYVNGVSPTPDALRAVIPSLLREGYEFVTVSELIGE